MTPPLRPVANNELKNLVHYWRTSLADEDMLGVKVEDSVLKLKADDLARGILLPGDYRFLRDAWLKKKKPTDEESQQGKPKRMREDATIPVVFLTKVYSPDHDHSKTNHEIEDAVFPVLMIPANIDTDGGICLSEARPWIARECLEPEITDGDEGPIVGEVTAVDTWLNKNPYQVETSLECFEWCERLWGHLMDQRRVDGFTLTDLLYVAFLEPGTGAAASIIGLYDGIEDSDASAPLFEKLALGHNLAVEIKQPEREAGLDLPRGTMSGEFGLAASQRDSVVAFTRLNDGDVLAVSGPPGTGKTTLLQSIIATEIVKRALNGGEPAVIVGASTNNQAVINIIDCLNAPFKQKQGSSTSPFNRRWFNAPQSLGLYLPSNTECEKAQLKGYTFAQLKNGSPGVPCDDKDGEFVNQAKKDWLENCSAAVNTEIKTIQAGLDELRRHLAGYLKDMEKSRRLLVIRSEKERVWQTIAGTIPPEEYIRRRRAAWDSDVLQRKQEYDSAVSSALTIKLRLDDLTKEMEAAKNHASEVQRLFKLREKDLLRVDATLHALEVQRGLFESLFTNLGFFKGYCSRKTIERFKQYSAGSSLTIELFERALRETDPSKWHSAVEIKLESERSDHATTFKTNQSRIRALSDSIKHSEGAWEHSKAYAMQAKKVFIDTTDRAGAELQDLERKLKELNDSRTAVIDNFRYLLCHLDHSKTVNDLPVCLSRTDKLKPTLDDFDVIFDITFRHTSFMIALRYWEGRWIAEMDEVQAGNVKSNRGKAGMEGRFRRWCMLTPCIITTMYMLPKHFAFSVAPHDGESKWTSKHLFNFIDVLIVDEAGQVAPHVGVAAFSLCKRAVVVGDVHQLEPVVKTPRSIDYGNAIDNKLGGYWEDGDPAVPHFLTAPSDNSPQGSIMLLAQRVSKYRSEQGSNIQNFEPGMFLAEHRRCHPDIIQYCNDLTYRGRLIPARTVLKENQPVPPLAWMNVQGVVERVANSFRNEVEAKTIVQWIRDNQRLWCDAYTEKDDAEKGKTIKIEDLVAIVTPYRPQADHLYRLLRRHKDLSKIVVGTVHKLQGGDKPIVIFSPTFSGSPGAFLSMDRKPNLLNVAVSRAKDSFVVIGDMGIFTPSNKPSGKLVKLLRGRGVMLQPPVHQGLGSAA